MPIQPAWPHKSIIQNVCSVSGGENNDVVCCSHSCQRKKISNMMPPNHSTSQQTTTKRCASPTVHLHQELVESLLLLSVGETGHIGGALLSHGVDLIDVDDARRSSTSLFKKTPDPGSTQTCTQSKRKSQPGDYASLNTRDIVAFILLRAIKRAPF